MWNWSKKIAVYIDWFNMFHHIKKLFGKKYYRLDYKKLASLFVWHNEKIVKVSYFTAYFYKDTSGVQRHKTYIKAINTSWVKTIFWKYQEVEKRFKNKNWINVISFTLNIFINWLLKSLWKEPSQWLPDKIIYKNYEEKRTDVNIAVNILQDWLDNLYDKCFIISWDSDITPAIKSIKKKYPEKEFIALLPPWAKAHTMSEFCDKTIEIKESHLQCSQFPEIFKWISKPKNWK